MLSFLGGNWSSPHQRNGFGSALTLEALAMGKGTACGCRTRRGTLEEARVGLPVALPISLVLGTYMSERIEVVVGELELLEGNQLPHPVGTSSRGVGMNVQPPGHGRLCFPRHRPAWGHGTELRVGDILHPSLGFCFLHIPSGGVLLPPFLWTPCHPGIPIFGTGEKRYLQTLRGELIELFGTFPVGDGSRCFPRLTPSFPTFP